MKIKIHSFSDVDRSGKVRWAAEELGYEIEELRHQPGEHLQPDFLAINPYGQMPAAELDGEVLIESSAICRILAERDPKSTLIPTDPADRAAFHQWCSVATESLEFTAVAYYLSRRGFMAEGLADIVQKPVSMRLKTLAGRLPEGDFVVPGQFSLADIFVAYSVRLGLHGKLLTMDEVGPYL